MRTRATHDTEVLVTSVSCVATGNVVVPDRTALVRAERARPDFAVGLPAGEANAWGAGDGGTRGARLVEWAQRVVLAA